MIDFDEMITQESRENETDQWDASIELRNQISTNQRQSAESSLPFPSESRPAGWI